MSNKQSVLRIDRVRHRHIDYENADVDEYLTMEEDGRDLIVKTDFMRILEIKSNEAKQNEKVFKIQVDKPFKKFLVRLYKNVFREFIGETTADRNRARQVRRIVRNVRKSKTIDIEQIDTDISKKKLKVYAYKSKIPMNELEINTVVNEILGNTEFGKDNLEDNSKDLSKPKIVLIGKIVFKVKLEMKDLKDIQEEEEEDFVEYVLPKLEILQVELNIQTN